MLRVYGDLQSGNCYKVKLLLAQLKLPHDWVHVDILDKQTRTPAFLAKNPNGKIPLLEIEEGSISRSPMPSSTIWRRERLSCPPSACFGRRCCSGSSSSSTATSPTLR